MNTDPWELLLSGSAIVLLILLNALFVAAEYSLIRLHFTWFDREKLVADPRGRAIARMLDRINALSRTIRLGVTTCTVALGFVLLPLVHDLVGALGVASDTLSWNAAIFVAFLVAVGIHHFIGELVPRGVALQYPVQALHLSSWLVRVFHVAASPLLSVLSAVSRPIFKAFRVEEASTADLIDVEVQIRSVLKSGEDISPLMEKILHNALELRRRVVQDVILPRNRIQYFDINDTLKHNLEIAKKTGHTRFPLCDGDLDRCIGLIHIKDIFRRRGPDDALDLRKIRREIVRFSPDDSLEHVLQRMLKQKLHMALVMDEFGGTVGVVTLEDILEELVGDIQDEFDLEESQIKSIGENGFLIDGLTPIHDVSEAMNIELRDEEVSTFGGLITNHLGRMPKEGESFTMHGLFVTVTAVDEKRVINAKARAAPEESDDPMEPG